jgi:hypothetical protein
MQQVIHLLTAFSAIYIAPRIPTTTSKDKNLFQASFIPELFAVAEVETAVVVVLATIVLFLVDGVGTPKRAVPEIKNVLAAAVAAKVAGVMVLVYEESNDSVTTVSDGYAVKAFPAELDKAALPGSPVGRLRGL